MSEAAASEPFEECANCGASFESDVWYPVATRRDDDGDLRVYSFCNEECRGAWTSEH